MRCFHKYSLGVIFQDLSMVSLIHEREKGVKKWIMDARRVSSLSLFISQFLSPPSLPAHDKQPNTKIASFSFFASMIPHFLCV